MLIMDIKNKLCPADITMQSTFHINGRTSGIQAYLWNFIQTCKFAIYFTGQIIWNDARLLVSSSQEHIGVGPKITSGHGFRLLFKETCSCQHCVRFPKSVGVGFSCWAPGWQIFELPCSRRVSSPAENRPFSLHNVLLLPARTQQARSMTLTFSPIDRWLWADGWIRASDQLGPDWRMSDQSYSLGSAFVGTTRRRFRLKTDSGF